MKRLASKNQGFTMIEIVAVLIESKLPPILMNDQAVNCLTRIRGEKMCSTRSAL